MKTNREIGEIFEEIGFLLGIKGENPFKIRAYNNAASIIKKLPFPLFQIKDKKELQRIEGIGDAISKKIIEIIETGDCSLHRKLMKEFPETILELKKIKGIGPKIAKKLYYEYKIESLKQLKEKLEQDGLSSILGKDKIKNIREYMEYKYEEK